MRFHGFSLLIFLLSQSYCQISIPGDHFNPIDKTDSTILNFYGSIKQPQEDGFKIVDPFTKASFNSHYARSYNDGPVWKGKGATLEAHFGFQGKKGKLSYTIYPVIYYSQNDSYPLATGSANLNPLNFQLAHRGGIDWVQRYGNEQFVAFHMGQSEIRYDLGKFVSSLSTQNYSWGPSRFNPILMSTQAGGFPHLRLGIKPFDLKIKNYNAGRAELNLMFGLLRESGYFDNDPDNDKRYFNSLSISYEPSFLKGLKFGFNKVLYKQTQYFEAEDILSPVYILESITREGNFGNDSFDQLASFTFEWVLPESNFRTYLEFALNDFSNVILEPDHTRGYTIGFEKRIPIEQKEVILQYEHTNLSSSSNFLYRATPSFFAHGVNRQGYTQNGQIIGAGIGVGANSDNLSISYLLEGNSYGVLFQRIESNKDFFLERIRDSDRRDQEYTTLFFYETDFEKYVFSLSAGYSYNFNRYFSNNRGNLSFSLGLRKKI